MTIERKIQFSTGVVVAFVIVMGSLVIWTSDRVEDGVKTLGASSRLLESAFMMHAVVDEMLAHGGTRPLRQWRAYEAQLGAILDNKAVFASVDRRYLTTLEKRYREVKALDPQVLLASLEETQAGSQEAKALKDTLAGMMSLRLEQLVEGAKDLYGACEVLTVNRRRTVRKLLFVMIVSTVFVVLANLYLIQRSVVPGLKKLARGAEAVGAGNLDYVVEAKGDDELASLARAFNLMVERLKKSYTSLQAEIAGRKRAQEDLTRSNKDLEQFAYVASHDLQEPLRNVASCMLMLEKKYEGKLDAEGDQFVRYAVESVTRMKDLINGLLMYSRISTKGNPFQPTDCEEVLERTMANMRQAIEQTAAVITHDPLPTVTADSTQLLQVFQNLIGNAIKFRGEGPPRIHVSAERENSQWLFSVQDNGIGIEPRHWDRIFVIFQRLHKRAAYDGTGMGLAIVKKIV